MKKLLSILRLTLPCMLLAAPSALAADSGAAQIDTGDTAWVLISAALVFIMTPGLGFFYGGMVRSKNVLTTIMQSFFIVAMISVEWIILGYAMTFGTDISGFIGSLDKVGLAGVGSSILENGTIPELAFVAFQCMFAVITPALITGAFAERVKFQAFAIFILLWAIFIYNPMAHWVWGGGFLAKLGALDFAGGLVIHILSGVSGLTLCLLLGKRHGLGKIPMLPHNLPMTVLGATLLWFGWFGFNAGSALGANALAANAFVTSQAAAAAATVSWVLIEWISNGKPTVLGAASGCIAGLVAITPAAGFVAPMPAIIIGAVGGVICYYSVALLKTKLGYDDSLDAFGIHGIGGTWGAVATGLWATTEVNPAGANGLFYGETHLLFAQIVSIFVAYALAIFGSFILFKIVNSFTSMRADKSEEVTGLDITEHGERGYNQAIMSGSPFEDTLSAPLNTSTINDIGMNNHNL
ncbi:ammonia channel protein [Megasphaera cerevisiae DSM 20462]|jgi:Amt family ammonium transporter|uniref:Ammonium transporter n=1 Tax=Megasphaera cerevisiae DSM 20462 TaxID=1122219 RepID=A0A0J6WW56_9FIRM|nr:ammonium transporter [Megasphaera cerevisiae]KMO86017.1 ammonia channel protein [Megasphaera cerevisiae DSM 20462]OKY54584.1 ammonia channel protein [Megasphaera cerevisiae]SKA05852.1 ammonium transporter (TC 1.A.11) [Megasphaera cerevisiae DSM 20462]